MSESPITSEDLREMRLNLGLTQAQFADLPELKGILSYFMVSRYEQGININSDRAQSRLRIVRQRIAPRMIGSQGQ